MRVGDVPEDVQLGVEGTPQRVIQGTGQSNVREDFSAPTQISLVRSFGAINGPHARSVAVESPVSTSCGFPRIAGQPVKAALAASSRRVSWCSIAPAS